MGEKNTPKGVENCIKFSHKKNRIDRKGDRGTKEWRNNRKE